MKERRYCDKGAAIAIVDSCLDCPEAKVIIRWRRASYGRFERYIDNVYCNIRNEYLNYKYTDNICPLPSNLDEVLNRGKK